MTRRCFEIWGILGAWALLCLAAPVAAASKGDHTDIALAQCIDQSSAGKPWLAKTLWGLRDQEGGWVGAAIRNSNGSDDLGPLQINSWWVPRIASMLSRRQDHVRWWLQHDACFNVEAARWIFLSALAVTKDYWRAVGVYHSPTEWRQRRYIGSVVSHLRRRFGLGIFAESISVP